MDQVDLPSNPNLKVRSKIIQKQSDDFGRKRWEVQHYEELVVPQQQPVESRQQKYLIARTQKLELQKNSRKDGFYCQVCNQLYKCDIAYLTHINSQFHNRKLGMSLKVEASSAEDVKNKLQKLSQNKPLSKIKQKINEKKARMENIIKVQLENAIKANAKKNNQEQSDQEEQDYHESDDSQQAKEIQKQNEDKKQTILELPSQKQQQPITEQKQPPTVPTIQTSTVPQQDPQQAMMKALGLPTKFKSKKR